jgi:hypothetical protein
LRNGRVLPRGALVKYREWYGCVRDRPNVGIKMHAEEVGRRLVELEENDDPISYGVLDPAAFAEDGGPSIREMLERGSRFRITWQRADNKRVSGRGTIGGWDQLRGRLAGIDGRPMIAWFNSCRDSIRTIPMLQHDIRRVEDLDTESEDHAADEGRYAAMSRPWVPASAPQDERLRFDYRPTERIEEADALTI